MQLPDFIGKLHGVSDAAHFQNENHRVIFLSEGKLLMRKTWIWPAIAAAAGLLGALLRAFENRYTVDLQTGLRISGHPLIVLMMLYCALAAAVVVIPFLHSRTAADGAALADSRGLKITAGICAAALTVFALRDLFRFTDSGRLSLLIFAGFSLFSAISVVSVAAALRRSGMQGGSVFAVVPVFWACFWLILSYGEHAADPVIVDYLYELLGESAVVIALYMLAQLLFDKKRLRSAVIFAQLSVFFSVLNLTEPLITLLLFKNDALMDNLISMRLYFIFPLVLMPAVSAALQKRMRRE